jgi:hypothetical protein
MPVLLFSPDQLELYRWEVSHQDRGSGVITENERV